MTRTGAAQLGEAVGVSGPPTLSTQILQRPPFVAMRLASATRRENGMMSALPTEDAFLVILNLRSNPPYRLWVEGREVPVAPVRAGTTVMYDLKLDPVASVSEPFDCLAFHIPRAALDAVADDAGVRRVDTLRLATGAQIDDAVIRGLGSSLLPAFDQPERANRLFVEHVALALQVHIAQAYGGMAPSSSRRRGTLASWQERRAKELLSAHLNGEVSINEVARQCGLSRSHFMRAFTRTTGQPPHRWLIARRIESARDLLLRSTLPIADIATRLGFADQSHFTRVFGSVVGHTPSAWRRINRR
jgi:AraC family transcriptional regulator